MADIEKTGGSSLPTDSGSIRISVNDAQDIDLELPLIVRNEIAFAIETEADIGARATQIEEILINHNYDIQKKAVGSETFAGLLIGLIAILLAKPQNNIVPVKLHLPHGGTSDQVKTDANENPLPSVAIFQTDAKDPNSLVTVTLVDEPESTASAGPCPPGPVSHLLLDASRRDTEMRVDRMLRDEVQGHQFSGMPVPGGQLNVSCVSKNQAG